jgi:ABC-type transport system involved in multi-copper enzyme maturation permease subunit
MNTWSLSFHGLATVVSLEIKQRLRSRKWLWALIAWALVIGAITVLVMWSMFNAYSSFYLYEGGSTRITDTPAGPMAFSLIVLFVIGMGLVVAPAFTATSINGDRSVGTLATLQATGLSALEIAGGKLISAWLTAGAFLVTTIPFIIVTMVFGNISVVRVLVCLGVLYLLIGVVCALGLGWSALFNRTAASTVMTYLSIVVFAVISPILVGLSLPFIKQEDMPVREWGLTEEQLLEFHAQNEIYWDGIDWDDYTWDDDGDLEIPPSKTDPWVDAPRPPVELCDWHDSTRWGTHTESVWWLLAPNPFVIVSDAAPVPKMRFDGGNDLLSGIRWIVRELSRPPATEYDECSQLYEYFPEYMVSNIEEGRWKVMTMDGKPADVPQPPLAPRPPGQDVALWPWGLGINLLVGAVFFWVAVRRLRIPYRTLAKGTRIA